MSRVGNKPVNVVQGVTVALEATTIVATGPKGSLTLARVPNLEIERDGQWLKIVIPENTRRRYADAEQGLQQALLANMITGVSVGFTKELNLYGVGYRATKEGKILVLRLGFSNDIRFPIPDNVNIDVDKSGLVITISGIDKQVVGSVAMKIRSFRPVEPYKGKGIKYAGEVVRRKEGKSK